jgi:hypothetical protein
VVSRRRVAPAPKANTVADDAFAFDDIHDAHLPASPAPPSTPASTPTVLPRYQHHLPVVFTPIPAYDSDDTCASKMEALLARIAECDQAVVAAHTKAPCPPSPPMPALKPVCRSPSTPPQLRFSSSNVADALLFSHTSPVKSDSVDHLLDLSSDFDFTASTPLVESSPFVLDDLPIPAPEDVPDVDIAETSSVSISAAFTDLDLSVNLSADLSADRSSALDTSFIEDCHVTPRKRHRIDGTFDSSMSSMESSMLDTSGSSPLLSPLDQSFASNTTDASMIESAELMTPSPVLCLRLSSVTVSDLESVQQQQRLAASAADLREAVGVCPSDADCPLTFEALVSPCNSRPASPTRVPPSATSPPKSNAKDNAVSAKKGKNSAPRTIAKAASGKKRQFQQVWVLSLMSNSHSVHG